MPFTMKGTLIFEGLGNGFTESYFWQASNNDLQFALEYLRANVVAKRQPLLGAQHYIKAWRVSVEYNEQGQPVRRDSRLQRTYLPGTAGQPSAQRDISLQVLFNNWDSSKRKLLFMGGVWKAINPEADAYNPNAAGWGTQFNAWKASLILNNFGWVGTTSIQQRLITSYTRVDGLVTGFTFGGTGFAWPAGYDTVAIRVSGVNTKSVVNGVQLVRPGTANTATLVKPIAAGPFLLPGTATLNTRGFIGLAAPPGSQQTGTVEGQVIMTRERGRPLLASRGRAPARART